MQSLTTFAALLLASVLFVPLFKRAGLGTVLGYLAVGMLIGPFGVKLVRDPDNLMHTAELGVVLLLFVIGLELKPSRLWALRRSVFGLGALQLIGSAAALAAAGRYLGLSLSAAALVGIILALSSTAFVLPTLAERGELSTRYGRDAFAILLFQDLSVSPLLALIPLFGTGKSTALTHPAVGLGLLVAVAVLSTALGYVSGAQLATQMRAEQVICWVLVLSLPLTLPVALWSWPEQPVRASAWAGFVYVTLFSMWIGFFAWYRGLAIGGTVRVSQVQLVQPFLGMLVAVPLLGERLDAVSVGFGLAVMATVLAGRRMPVRAATPAAVAAAAVPRATHNE